VRSRRSRGDSRGFSGIAGLLGALVPNRAWPKNLSRAAVWQHWSRIVGPAIARETQPWYFNRDDFLVIAVSDSIWMQQLSYEKGRLLEKINACLPKEARIEGLAFRLADVGRVRRLLAGRRGLMEEAQKRALAERAARLQEAGAADGMDGGMEAWRRAVDQVEDQELKRAFLSLLEKARPHPGSSSHSSKSASKSAEEES